MRKVVRAGAKAQVAEPSELDETYVAKLANAYKGTKDAINNFTKQADKIKAELVRYVIDHGQPDENGSLWLEVNGIKLKRERRVSRSLDRAAAEEWAKEKGIWEQVSEVIPEHRELDEDKLLKLAWDTLGDAETTTAIQSFYTENESWAFRTP